LFSIFFEIEKYPDNLSLSPRTLQDKQNSIPFLQKKKTFLLCEKISEREIGGKQKLKFYLKIEITVSGCSSKHWARNIKVGKGVSPIFIPVYLRRCRGDN